MNQAEKMFQLSGVVSDGKKGGKISDDQAGFRDSMLMSFVNTPPSSPRPSSVSTNLSSKPVNHVSGRALSNALGVSNY